MFNIYHFLSKISAEHEMICDSYMANVAKVSYIALIYKCFIYKIGVLQTPNLSSVVYPVTPPQASV